MMTTGRLNTPVDPLNAHDGILRHENTKEISEISDITALREELRGRRIKRSISNNSKVGRRDDAGIVIEPLLRCFGVLGVDDNRLFCRTDMQNLDTPRQVSRLVPLLCELYPPCKARVYLDQPITDRRCITILKQVLRLLGKTLLSRERNINGHKTIYYQVIDKSDVHRLYHMTKRVGGTHPDDCSWVSFERD